LDIEGSYVGRVEGYCEGFAEPVGRDDMDGWSDGAAEIEGSIEGCEVGIDDG